MANEPEIRDENLTPDSEEEKQEEEVLKESNEDEVRSQVIEKFGLDEEEQSELVDRLTQDALDQRKAFGKVVQQKRKWREVAEQTKPTEEPKREPKPEEPDLDALINERFEQRDLDELDYPEDLKPEVKKIAQLQGVSVRQAAKDPYILHRKNEIEEAERVEESAISRKNKGTPQKFDPDSPPEVDLSTEDGRKVWKEYKEFLKRQG